MYISVYFKHVRRCDFCFVCVCVFKMNSKNSKSPAIPTLKINQTSEDREIEKLTKELQKHKEMR